MRVFWVSFQNKFFDYKEADLMPSEIPTEREEICELNPFSCSFQTVVWKLEIHSHIIWNFITSFFFQYLNAERGTWGIFLIWAVCSSAPLILPSHPKPRSFFIGPPEYSFLWVLICLACWEVVFKTLTVRIINIRMTFPKQTNKSCCFL